MEEEYSKQIEEYSKVVQKLLQKRLRHCLGSHEFNNPDELKLWLWQRVLSHREQLFYRLESFIELFSGLDSKLFRAVRRVLIKRLRQFRAQLNSRFIIRAIITPLRLNPHSLHPNGSATQCESWVVG